MGTSHCERTDSFETWSCHLTPSIVHRHRDWNTFSLSHTERESVQPSQPCNTVGTINDWKSFTLSFTGKAVLQKTFDNDLNVPRPRASFASTSVVSLKSEVNSTPRYLNDSVYSILPHGSWIASLSGWSTEHPSVIQNDFSALSTMPCSVKTSSKTLRISASSDLLSASMQKSSAYASYLTSMSPMRLLAGGHLSSLELSCRTLVRPPVMPAVSSRRLTSSMVACRKTLKSTGDNTDPCSRPRSDREVSDFTLDTPTPTLTQNSTERRAYYCCCCQTIIV